MCIRDSHILADDPEVYAGLDGAKISRVNAAQRKFMAPWRERCV